MPTKPADWSALPKGEMLPLAEAAAIIGMSVKSLYTHYTGQKSLRSLPEGITLITKNGRAKYIVRTQEIETMKTMTEFQLFKQQILERWPAYHTLAQAQWEDLYKKGLERSRLEGGIPSDAIEIYDMP